MVLADMLFVLGAGDPEMEAIEGLLKARGLNFVYAQANGRRVHPGNAYGSDPIAHDGPVALVECQPRGGIEGAIFVDHHRPGDPGYGLPPDRFLEASSIGQVFCLLHTPDGMEMLPPSFKAPGDPTGVAFTRREEVDEETGEATTVDLTAEVTADRWVLVGAYQPDPQDTATEYFEVAVPEDVLLVAAADHCLAHAYRGKCPGVDPDALMTWRITSRAKFQGRDPEEVMADVGRARERLRDAWWEAMNRPVAGLWRGIYAIRPEDNGGVSLVEGDGYGGKGDCAEIITLPPIDTIVDLRGESIAELPEAGAREGIAYMSSVVDRDGRTKVVVGSASPEQVEAWFSWAKAEGLEGIYGDPARGFAGGYVRG